MCIRDSAGSVATSFGNVAAELTTLPACLLVYTGDIAGQATASLDASVSVSASFSASANVAGSAKAG